jgi:hypothetical protein
VARRQLLCSLDQQKRTAAKLRHFMVSEFGIAILPDLLANDLDLVIVGTAAGRVSAERQLYYAGPAIGSGAYFTKLASRRLNRSRTTTLSCSTTALG